MDELVGGGSGGNVEDIELTDESCDEDIGVTDESYDSQDDEWSSRSDGTIVDDGHYAIRHLHPP